MIKRKRGNGVPNARLCTHVFSLSLTNDDGVDLALHLDGGVVAGEDVDDLLQLRLLDHQVVSLLKVLLERRSQCEDSRGGGSLTARDG